MKIRTSVEEIFELLISFKFMLILYITFRWLIFASRLTNFPLHRDKKNLCYTLNGWMTYIRLTWDKLIDRIIHIISLLLETTFVFRFFVCSFKLNISFSIQYKVYCEWRVMKYTIFSFDEFLIFMIIFLVWNVNIYRYK